MIRWTVTTVVSSELRLDLGLEICFCWFAKFYKFSRECNLRLRCWLPPQGFRLVAVLGVIHHGFCWKLVGLPAAASSMIDAWVVR